MPIKTPRINAAAAAITKAGKILRRLANNNLGNEPFLINSKKTGKILLGAGISQGKITSAMLKICQTIKMAANKENPKRKFLTRLAIDFILSGLQHILKS